MSSPPRSASNSSAPAGDVWSRVSDGSSPAIASYELNNTHASPHNANKSSSNPLGDYQQDLLINDLTATEQFTQKLKRKCKEDPLVPVGFVATCAMLSGGLISMLRGQSMLSNYFMRGRVGFQAFTAVVASIPIIKMTYDMKKNSDEAHKRRIEKQTGEKVQSDN